MTTLGHPATHTVEYSSWRQMIARCLDPYHTRWPKYGGAGVQVFEAWHSFDGFRRDMGRRPEGHVLSRRDKGGDYTPDNCYWERREEAARRYRSSTTLTYQGETLLIAEWSRRLGLPTERIRRRFVAYGWSVGEALGLEPRNLSRFKGADVCPQAAE